MMKSKSHDICATNISQFIKSFGIVCLLQHHDVANPRDITCDSRIRELIVI